MSNFYPQIEAHVHNLKQAIETFLERPQDEEAERQAIAEALVEILEGFISQNLPKSTELIRYLLKQVEVIEPLGTRKEEREFLQVGLLLESFVEAEKLGLEVDDTFFMLYAGHLLPDTNELWDFSHLNYSLIAILRTHFQKELLALIQEKDASGEIVKLADITEALISEVPPRMRKEWRALNFLLMEKIALSENQEKIVVKEFIKLLAMLDQKLADILYLREPKNFMQPELIEFIHQLPDGYSWLAANLHTYTVYLNSGVFARLSEGMRDSLLQLHESFELFYLDHSSTDLMQANLPFLENLQKIVFLAGFENLSQFVARIITNLEVFCQSTHDQTIDDRPLFYHLVNSVWILENLIDKLHQLHDSEVPKTKEEMRVWSIVNSTRSVYRAMAMKYHSLHTKLVNGKIDKDDLCSELLELSYTETHFRSYNPLAPALKHEALLFQLETSALEPIVLALEYIANKNSTGGEIEPAFISEALTILERYSPVSHPKEMLATSKIKSSQIKPANGLNVPQANGSSVAASTQTEALGVTDTPLTDNPSLKEKKSTLTKEDLREEELKAKALLDDSVLLEAIEEETKILEEEAHQLFTYADYTSSTLASLARIAHTLKSNIRLIHLDHLAEELNQIEQELTFNPTTDEEVLMGVKSQLEGIFTQINHFLQTTLEDHPSSYS